MPSASIVEDFKVPLHIPHLHSVGVNVLSGHIVRWIPAFQPLSPPHAPSHSGNEDLALVLKWQRTAFLLCHPLWSGGPAYLRADGVGVQSPLPLHVAAGVVAAEWTGFAAAKEVARSESALGGKAPCYLCPSGTSPGYSAPVPRARSLWDLERSKRSGRLSP